MTTLPHHVSNDGTSAISKDGIDPAKGNSFNEEESVSDEKDDETDEVTEQKATSSQPNTISKHESADVHRFKFILLFILLVIAVTVSTCVYIFISKAEQSRFEHMFNMNTLKVVEAVRNSIDNTLTPMDELAVAYVSYAKDRNLTWPFVTLPDFAVRVAKILPSTDAIWITILPVVTPANRLQWESYSQTHDEWVESSSPIQDHWEYYYGPKNIQFDREYEPYIHDQFYVPIENNVSRSMLPQWQMFPSVPIGFTAYNSDWLSVTMPEAMWACNETHRSVLSTAYLLPDENDPAVADEAQAWLDFYSFFVSPNESAYEPVMDIFFPIIDDISQVEVVGSDNYNASDNSLVGMLVATVYWRNLIRNTLPPSSKGITVVVSNECEKPFTYQINGPDVVFLGVGDRHETKYDKMKISSKLTDLENISFAASVYSGAPIDKDFCPYTLHFYPTNEMRSDFISNNATIFASVSIVVAIALGIVFLTYDFKVENRQKKVLESAIRSSEIVSSLFPESVRDRLYPVEGRNASKPLADLYIETTVMFADICGFTAWSSIRDPTQVFMLLETLFKAFDAIASRRRVFKVETVGDCYVAAAGLPEPRKDHAIAMVRFARDIMVKASNLTKVLELTLGPGTGELQLRIGIHSGPVTGGVLRGERSRFQLFGDTMNTTARIESSGERGRIHVSAETAKLLNQAGKQSWLKKRDQCITAKGKGSMQTYWLSEFDNRDDISISAGSVSKHSVSSGLEVLDDIEGFHDGGKSFAVTKQTARLIKWNVEQLLILLKQIVARRSLSKLPSLSTNDTDFRDITNGMSPIEEVQEIITLPEFDSSTSNQTIVDVDISPIVVSQLKEYVTWVASMYKNNPFHNFDHASHVVMSVVKLMSRIVAPTDQHINDNAATLHDHTYGITSDPLTQFACAFSALIHDVDHTGVPNTTLVSEHTTLAAKYNNRSVAEQNSLNLAWGVLMDETKYGDLRAALFTNQTELIRFRKLVVNSVMATDIADKDLKTLRNNRWDTAFKIEKTNLSPSKKEQSDAVNRKATIVIEHLIQASDVSHTMQHWHVFRKWNQSLFEEMYDAYVDGRAEKNPVDFWYQGEIGFFDFYIIPLAKKLKDCGVFGVSSDEYLNYAMKNREEWESRGHEIVAEMVESVVNAKKCVEQVSIPTTIDPSTKKDTRVETHDDSYAEC